MQKLAEICIKRPVFAAMIILALVVVGASSYFKLGVDRFPAIDVPTVTVRASLPGASPEEAEATLAQIARRGRQHCRGCRTAPLGFEPGPDVRHGDFRSRPRH